MDCVRCGNPTPERAAFCPACGARVPGGPPPAPPTIRSDRPLVSDDTTVVAPPEGAGVSRPPSAEATVISQAGGTDATVSVAPLVPRVPADVTVVAAGTDATLIGRPPTGRQSDADATVVGGPLDADATFIGGAALGGATAGDATVLGPPRRKGGTTARTSMRSAAARAARTAGGHRVQGEDGGGPLSIGEQFGRYTIIRLLGIGGMGAVYQAWDEELEVVVALKVIQTDDSIDAATVAEVERRFKRELLLARRVTHKNVVRIFDLGEIDGIKYITMSYVNGVDLTHLLEAEGKLPLPKALRIIRGAVDGLVAAHDADVVHRDLKPANIMLATGSDEPLIMDFGIARTTSAPQDTSKGVSEDDAGFKASSALANATMAGAVVGTLGYMAPEQAKGQDVDQRADVYALGLIFYDLLLGMRRQEATPKPFEELMLRMKEPPPSPRSVNEEIPEDIDRIIMRCVDPDPEKRYASSEELKHDLDALDAEGRPLPKFRRLTPRLVAAASLAMVTLLGLTYWLVRPTIEVQPDAMPVLVADFENRTGDPVFNGTLEQALGAGLEGASFITAFSRQSAQQLADQIKPGSRLDPSVARLVSAREGIKVVLAGSIASAGKGYEIKVDAIDPANDAVLTTARARAPSRNEVLAAIGTVAADLRGALGDTTPESARIAASETVTASSLEALQAYTRAQELQAGRNDEAALAAYRDAVRLDPNFGRAYAGMGVVYWNLRDDDNAKTAYDKALQLVDRMTDREKYRTLGSYYMFIARNYEKAVENYEVLVKLFPADDAGRGNLSIAYLFTGNLEGAITQVREVLKLNPRSSSDRYNYAIYSLYAGDLDTAIKEGLQVAQDTPSMEAARVPVALASLLKGDQEGAIAAYRQMADVSPFGAALADVGRADLEAYRGQYRTALGVLQDAIRTNEKSGATNKLANQYAAAAEAYVALGQQARAIEAARKARRLSSNESVLVPAALVFVTAGRYQEAEEIALELENMLQAHMTAYARLIQAQVAVQRSRHNEAIETFRDSIKRRDTWLARYLLGRAYAQLGRFPEAMAELDLCIKRRGEAADAFFYDTPSVRYLPPAYYWLARAQQPLGVADARKNYEHFLSLRQNADPPDPLAVDAKKRLGS